MKQQNVFKQINKINKIKNIKYKFMWLTTKQYRDRYQISPQCLYEMKKHNRIQTKDTNNGRYLIYVEDEGIENNIVIYARVSTVKQKKDLDNQIDYLKKYCISNGENPYQIFSDIGSGMNEQRKGLNDLLSLVIEKKVSKIVISHKDRLTRFGFGYLESICNKFGAKIEIVNLEDDKSFQEELTEDLIAIIHHFSMKFYGKRKNNCKQLEANANLLKNIEDK